MKLITWEFQNATVHIEFDSSEVSEHWTKQTNLDIDGLFDQHCTRDELNGNRIYWGWYDADGTFWMETDLLPSQSNVIVVMKGV